MRFGDLARCYPRYCLFAGKSEQLSAKAVWHVTLGWTRREDQRCRCWC